MCFGSVRYWGKGCRAVSESNARFRELSKFSSLRLKFGVFALAILLAMMLRRTVATSISRVRISMFFPNAPENVILPVLSPSFSAFSSPS